MEKLGLAVDKFVEVVLNTEWQAISAGLALRPFDWRLEGIAVKYNLTGQCGPVRVWARLN